MNSDDDAVLMGRAAAGDEKAFAGIVRRYQDVLLNFFLRAGVSFSDGQDLAQRTFLRLWRYRHRYRRTEAKFTTFLFLMARQVSLDFFRSETRRQTLKERWMRTGGAETAARRRLGSPQAEAVIRALKRLAPVSRETVELVVFQDLPYAEAARILGVPEGTVKSRVFNALEKLRGFLKR